MYRPTTSNTSVIPTVRHSKYPLILRVRRERNSFSTNAPPSRLTVLFAIYK